MPATIEHPCFTPPDDLEVKVWRYMDFTKYVDMLESSCLYFARSDCLNDQFEGSMTKLNVDLRPEMLCNSSIPAKDVNRIVDELSRGHKNMRQNVFLNCWHMNEYESAAMWKLYAKSNEAIAVQSTFKSLQLSLPSNVYMGIVHYIDYDKEIIPEGNIFWPFVHKRRSFEHEREVRGIILDTSQTDSRSAFGKKISVDLNNIVHRIYVSPTSPKWFADLVPEVTKRYDYNFEVIQSDLAKEPLF